MADKAIHVAILAGEHSGDLLGGALMASLKAIYPNIRFTGIGGANMAAQGLNSLVSMQRLAVMGLVEVIKHLPDLLRVKKEILHYWQNDVPDVFIGIDAPDFNLRIAKALHVKQVATVHYVSPSLWAWKEKRINVIKESIDLVLCLFPFETDVYDKHGVEAVCVGHPLRDRLSPRPQHQARRLAGFAQTGQLLGIFPGSRHTEIKRMLPLYLVTLKKLRKQLPNLQAFVSVSDVHHQALIKSLLDETSDACVHISTQASDILLNACDVALLSSGTITLESALLNTPMVVAYKVNVLTAAIARRLLKIDRFALPNLLDHRDLVPELIQEYATPTHMAEQLLALLTNKSVVESQRQGFARIAEKLPYNVSDKAAKAIARLLSDN